MLSPLERLPFACRTCFDVRLVMLGDVEDDCPVCAGWAAEHRLERLRADTAARSYKPEITEGSLTREEQAEHARLKRFHPDAHPLTVLAWIEGRRYDPKDDEDFIRLCERRLAKWRFYREAQEQEIAAEHAPAKARKPATRAA